MNETQTNSPVPDDLSSQVASLRCQVTLLLLVLIVISGTLTTYLFYQAHSLGNDVGALEPQAREVIQNYNKNLPNIQKFVQELVTYGQAHPDFQPILKKYGIPLTLSGLTNSAPRQ
ncbi:MAG TPA: hypothetical protein VMA35_00790 [Candidatus Sulfopaludibacter sp.]|nr:hypothetical protein [Candidatus Sulfopaludibacter sp.]